ncbi:hypothetical protein GCM10010191_67180 [Actinomadura vinacea]|uniref:Uncharacterized protein n=1 Tax=Actinomadura vinacea TaxID=115336 RepID=A0ABP5X3V8_9ACTN
MRRLAYLGLGLMVLATGGYTVVYLVRWEWQRSLMAGELLLVCLIVLLAVAGAQRLQRMEQRLAALVEGRPAPRAAEEVPRFRWLEPEPHSYKVFIPVLLGAGIVASGLAALVERVATALGRGRGDVRVPEALRLPSGGVLDGAAEPVSPGRGRNVVWAVVVLLVAAVAVVELAERTQDRSDPPMRAVASTLIIKAETNGRSGAVDPLATRLWEYCRGSTRPYLPRGGLVPLDGARFALVVQPALGEHALRRLRGCLEDAVVDHGRFTVQSVRHG